MFARTSYKPSCVNLTATVYHDDLVAKCKQGDKYSYELLYHRYAKAMFNTSLRIVNNRADAEDVLQESFIAAFRLDSFDYSSTFGAWLKRIVINKSIDVLRRRNMGVVEMNDGLYESVADTGQADDDYTQLKAEAIKKAMIQLPAGYRTVLSLYLFEGYDYEEISAIMGISETTVRTQYHRGKLKLLQLMQKGG